MRVGALWHTRAPQHARCTCMTKKNTHQHEAVPEQASTQLQERPTTHSSEMIEKRDQG